MSMVLQASEMLADASIVPAFIRMCGATFGHGCAMGLQAEFPKTVPVPHFCLIQACAESVLPGLDARQYEPK